MEGLAHNFWLLSQFSRGDDAIVTRAFELIVLKGELASCRNAIRQVATTRDDVVMKSNDIEQLTDELIGVAVLSLLKDNSPINTRALLTRLMSMEANEKDIHRRTLLGRVIAEISSDDQVSLRRDAGSKRDEWNNEGTDNVYPLFSNKQLLGNTKKH